MDKANQVLQVTRDKKSGKIENIKFFKEFYDSGFDEQGRHLKSLLEIHDSKPSNGPTD